MSETPITDKVFQPEKVGTGEAFILERKNNEMKKILQDIIDNCVHPDIAIRAIQVNLAPIRKVLKDNESIT